QQNLKNAINELEIKKKVAEANRVETSSLTPAILTKMYLDKWDGKLPQVVNDKAGIMYNFKQN
ncbi:MAG: prohibitin family protein, partial [Fusobacteriaceae bacterium]